MPWPFKLISTDFDGTVHTDFEVPAVSGALDSLLREFQADKGAWVINTGRDLASLLETLKRSGMAATPDYVVVVEREIYRRVGSNFHSLDEWNDHCTATHAELFDRFRPRLPSLVEWVRQNFDAHIYEDSFSPFCLIARTPADAAAIHEHLGSVCADIEDVTIVRNDVYARLSHVDFNKGTALAEISARLRIEPEEVLAAGDHLNDLPMLDKQFAHWLVAPANAVPEVKLAVSSQGGHVSSLPWSHGVAEGIRLAQGGI
jgi:HAD superfamily hydrolase (TIGR01484 family)